MPVRPTYPGVYIEEIPSGVRTITGVATSVTAFVGRTRRGPTNKAVKINGFADFERIFGGLWVESTLGFAIRDFYMNGGSEAIVVRLYHADAVAAKSKLVLGEVKLEAAYEGAWGANLRATIDQNNISEEIAQRMGLTKADLFNLTVREDVPGGNTEKFLNISTKNSARRVDKVLLDESRLVRWDGEYPSEDKKAVEAMKRKENDWLDKKQIVQAKIDAGETPTDAEKKAEEEARVAFDKSKRAASFVGVKVVDVVTLAESDWLAKKQIIQTRVDAGVAPSDVEKKALEEAETALVKARKSAAAAEVIDAVTLAENEWLAKKKIVQDKKNVGEVPTDKDIEEEKKAKGALDTARKTAADAVSDGSVLAIADFLPPSGEDQKLGLYALEQADIFNILCLPPYKADNNIDVPLIAAAALYCEKRRAMLLVDAPANWNDKFKAVEDFLSADDKVGTNSRNAALYFPRIKQPNPLRDNQMEEFAPCGVVAGVYARTDAQRGVWKAPAGLDATLVGVPQLEVVLTDGENGDLNPLGINCLRAFPQVGRVVWGARTLRGADQLADEYKYVPVRRTALFIEESLYRGLKWVVFEPNDEPLWAQIRLNAGAFMHNLFRQGAFQGSTPREAYFVRCDKETTTQNDINLGIVNVVVGFAPLKPAEFVVVKIQQIAGQIEV